MIRTIRAECLLDTRNAIGEGLLWDDEAGVLWWVDVPMPSRIFRYEPATGKLDNWSVPEMVAALALRREHDGLIIACHSGIGTFDPATGTFEHQLRPEPSKPFNRSNDAGVDPLGNLWFGTMQNNIAPDGSGQALIDHAGSLYRMAPDFSLAVQESGIAIPNTLCWDEARDIFYFTDSLTGVISAYDFDRETASLSGKRPFAHFDRGLPDGSTVDSEGGLWNARWDGGCVVRFAPGGTIDMIVEVPCDNVTSCAFVGPDRATLAITTARFGLSDERLEQTPHAGGLFTATPGFLGMPTRRFRG